MALKFNPVSGNFDLVNTSSGGATNAASVSYTPTTPSSWVSPVPTNVQEALDNTATNKASQVDVILGALIYG